MEKRRNASSLAFVVLLLAGEAALWWLLPSRDVALAAGAGWVVFLVFVVAAGDLAALLAPGRPRFLAWLPEWPLPAWLEPIRGSFVALAFLYGVLLGHFFWR